jgi:hypothetical protein
MGGSAQGIKIYLAAALEGIRFFFAQREFV